MMLHRRLRSFNELHCDVIAFYDQEEASLKTVNAALASVSLHRVQTHS